MHMRNVDERRQWCYAIPVMVLVILAAGYLVLSWAADRDAVLEELFPVTVEESDGAAEASS